MSETRVGVLALQGDFREHLRTLAACGVEALPIRLPQELAAVDALVLPGGESTTIIRLLQRYELIEPVRRAAQQGMPMLGTCAGLIVMARDIVDGEADQERLAILDITVRRNAFGRQVDSFEADLKMQGLEGDGFRGIFIRSPLVERTGPQVQALARFDGQVVAVRQGHLLGLSFHPELTTDLRLHRYFLELVPARR